MSVSSRSAIPVRLEAGIASYGAIAAESVELPQKTVLTNGRWQHGRTKGVCVDLEAVLAVSGQGREKRRLFMYPSRCMKLSGGDRYAGE